MLDPAASIPHELRHTRFIATPLTAEVAALDHAAYMASPDVIRTHSDGRWPLEGFTLAEDRALVARHQADHEAHRAFTFTLLAPARDEALGCLYVNPLRDYLSRAQADADTVGSIPQAAAMVSFWIRQDRQHTDLPVVVAGAVNDWLADDWPLAMHLFRILPGETTSRAALDRLGLETVSLGTGERPYLWYRAPASGAGAPAATPPR